MSLEYAHGAVQWLAADGVSTNYTVSGLSFQPKAIRFYWMGIQSAADALTDAANLRRGIGFAVSTSSRRCVGSFAQDMALEANCGTVARDDAVACTTDGAGGSDGMLDITAFNSDGFTLTVDDATPANLTIFWEAWGGSDITVAVVGDIAEPAATGNQDYAVTGFVAGAGDQVVMLAGVQSVAALNTGEANDSGLFVGFASGAGAANVVIIGNSDDLSVTMDTDSYGRGDECLGMIVIGGGSAVNARAALTQFGTDNFRLNWAARATTARRSIFMAIKGGSWHVGDYTIAGNTGSATATVSGLSFAPKGISLIGVLKAEHASNAAGTEDRMSLGSGSSPSSRRSMGMLDEVGNAICEIDLILEYDSVLCFTSNGTTVASAYDINAMNSDGFKIIVDTAGGVASEWHGYLTFGDALAGAAEAVIHQAVYHGLEIR